MKKKAQIPRLVRLFGSGWEEWTFSPGAFKAAQSTVVLGGADAILALPARSVMVAPIWINAVDPEIVRTSIALELEVRGLLPKKTPADAIVSRALIKADRTLVIATIFPQSLPASVAQQVFGRYEASPALLELEPDSVTLWQEGADLVAAFTRGKDLVYWTTCDAGDQAGLSGWVETLSLQLQALGVLEKTPGRFFLGEGLEDSAEILAGTPGSDSRRRATRVSLAPVLDHAHFEWKPEAAQLAERRSLAAQKIRKGLKVLVGAYALLAILAGLFVAWLNFQESRLKARVADLEKQVGSFEPLIQNWKTIGPSAEQEFFPLEILHLVVQGMPRNGLRLTTYDVTDGQVIVEGEASSVSLASQFFGAVSKEPGLAGFQWEMPPPVLLPSNAARFHLTGAAR